MERFGRVIGAVFGAIMISLSILVTTETIIRKVFSISLGGVDELSGYAMAIGAPLAFAVATIERSHIRINVLYSKFPTPLQGLANLASVLATLALSVFFLIFGLETLNETVSYQSLAQTPWATPLVYPQSVWVGSMIVFVLIAGWIALRALRALVRDPWGRLAAGFGPERVEEELEAELQDLSNR